MKFVEIFDYMDQAAQSDVRLEEREALAVFASGPFRPLTSLR